MELNSSYFYWDITGDGLLHVALVWDFDLSLGNDNTIWTTAYSDPTMLLASDELYTWYPGLLEIESFREEVLSRYERVFRPLLERSIASDITQLETTISSARAMDDIRWEGKLNKTSENSAAATERMREFMEHRVCFLDDIWLAGERQTSNTDDMLIQPDPQETVSELAHRIFRQYGFILCVLGLFGLVGILLVVLDWRRGRRTGA